MEAFLKQVANHYFEKGDISSRCFVLPSRRCVVFFKKYLSSLVAGEGKTMVSPGVLTVSDFFHRLSGQKTTDRIELLMTLLDCWNKVGGEKESLDNFIFWGDMILGDFSDVDKYEINPEWIFSNIAEFKSISAGTDFLSETQKEAIAHFVHHFEKDGQKFYKGRFRSVWDLLLPLYKEFNAELTRRGETYEGRLYRELSSRFASRGADDVLAASDFREGTSFVFAGLNVLCKCEKNILLSMKEASRAEFCWDYSSQWIKDPINRSSFFMESNLEDFPQAFTPDPEGLGLPEINLVGVPSNMGQARQLSKILSLLPSKGQDSGTAVVLPDSTQLLPLLNSIPADIRNVNVTMGVPMSESSLWALMEDIAAAQMHLRKVGEEWFFYHRQVLSIFSNPLFQLVLSDKEKEAIRKLKASPKPYFPEQDFKVGELMEAIFRPVATDLHSTGLVPDLQEYQRKILLILADRIQGREDLLMELDFIRDFYLSINKLSLDRKLEVLPATYFSLVDSLVGKAGVAFHGEPLRGLQVMGPLETRALDFENVIIFNCNEGIFPRRSQGESFIPSELRKGFELPTYEYMDAVWAYYFYRLIQRAKNVWMLYDTRTEGTRTGEESRYIKQLELHFKAPVHRYIFDASISPIQIQGELEKTQEHLEKIRASKLSASAVKKYMDCPRSFFYSVVEKLKEPVSVTEYLDARTLGTVFHKVMETVYNIKDASLDYLRSWLGNDKLEALVRKTTLEILNTIELSGRSLIFEKLIVKYCKQTISADIENLKARGRNSLKILGTEVPYVDEIFSQKFIGIVDRLDSPEEGVIRIVDYKTGAPDDIKEQFQLYVYDKLVSPKYPGNRVSVSIYRPFEFFTKGVQEDFFTQEDREQWDADLEKMLKEMFDTSVPWVRCDDGAICDRCPYKTLCGK